MPLHPHTQGVLIRSDGDMARTNSPRFEAATLKHNDFSHLSLPDSASKLEVDMFEQSAPSDISWKIGLPLVIDRLKVYYDGDDDDDDVDTYAEERKTIESSDININEAVKKALYDTNPPASDLCAVATFKDHGNAVEAINLGDAKKDWSCGAFDEPGTVFVSPFQYQFGVTAEHVEALCAFSTRYRTWIKRYYHEASETMVLDKDALEGHMQRAMNFLLSREAVGVFLDKYRVDKMREMAELRMTPEAVRWINTKNPCVEPSKAAMSDEETAGEAGEHDETQVEDTEVKKRKKIPSPKFRVGGAALLRE